PLFETHHGSCTSCPPLHPHFPPLSTSASPLFLFVYSFASFTCISTLRNRRTVKLMGPLISSARSFSTGWDGFCTVGHQPNLTLAKVFNFKLKHICQVGKERRFMGVFDPKWGMQFILYPKI